MSSQYGREGGGPPAFPPGVPPSRRRGRGMAQIRLRRVAAVHGSRLAAPLRAPPPRSYQRSAARARARPIRTLAKPYFSFPRGVTIFSEHSLDCHGVWNL